MLLAVRRDKDEAGAKSRMECHRRIAHDVKATAPGRTVLGEGRYQDVPPGSDSMADLPSVPGAQLSIGQKMKDGAVMPESVTASGELRVEDVRFDPVNPRCARAQRRLGNGQRRRR